MSSPHGDPAAAPASDRAADTPALTAWPGVGRRHEREVRVNLADAAPDGRARLDAIARWLQDTAYDDVVVAGVADESAWVVRTVAIEVRRFPRFGEALLIQTWVDGVGRHRAWARRRTTLRGEHGGHVETVATWVCVDPATGRPTTLTDTQLGLWLPSAQGRETKARLAHPPVTAGAAAQAWRFRPTDLDVAQHINNAVYWETVEDRLVTAAPQVPFSASIEHRAAAQAGDATVRRDGAMTWISDAGGVLCASIELAPGRTLSG